MCLPEAEGGEGGLKEGGQKIQTSSTGDVIYNMRL